MRYLNKCEICKSKKIKFLFNGKDKLFGIPGEFPLFKCKNCKTIFLNPQLSYKESEKFYPKDKYHSLENIRTEGDSLKTKINLKLYKIYFSEKNNILKRILFSPVKFVVRGTIIKKREKLLDIGCGSGQFLYEMKSLGLEVYGVEPGDFNKEDSNKYKLNIKNLELIKAKYPKEFFDLITINHVFEHIDNPNETMIEMHRILKKNGTLIIGVPNTNSMAEKIFGKNWLAFDVPRHLFDYSDKNIRFLLEKNKFKVLKIRYNSRPTQFIVSLYFLLNIKKRTGILNRILELIFLPLTWLVNSLKVGDQIEILCVKK
jgi:2-polyprenyl-3-methyl-5-hydroxy-6-metoxy-1,4-benzoquinol methylase